MKKIILVFSVLLICALAWAQEPVLDGKPFELSGGVGAGIGMFQVFLKVGAQFFYDLSDTFKVGFDLEYYMGFATYDMYVCGYVLAKIWYFYAGPGIVFKVRDARLYVGTPYTNFAYLNPPVAIAATIGANVPLFELGPGRLGFTCSIDWFPTDLPSSMSNPNPVAAYFSSMGLNALGYASAFKLFAEASYTIQF
jgi:hypothetical protein